MEHSGQHFAAGAGQGPDTEQSALQKHGAAAGGHALECAFEGRSAKKTQNLNLKQRVF